jgi:hypothetical protein
LGQGTRPPNPFAAIGWPNITGVQFETYTEGDNRRGLHSRITTASQAYSWIKGKHTVSFGGGFFRGSPRTFSR